MRIFFEKHTRKENVRRKEKTKRKPLSLSSFSLLLHRRRRVRVRVRVGWSLFFLFGKEEEEKEEERKFREDENWCLDFSFYSPPSLKGRGRRKEFQCLSSMTTETSLTWTTKSSTESFEKLRL